MLTDLNTSNTYHLALLIGVFVAIRHHHTYGVTPGGLIVPGSLVILFIVSPVWCLTVLGLSVLVYGIYQHWFRRTDYKRRTPMYILACLSLGLSSTVALCYAHFGWIEFSLDLQVGNILPGIIAFNFSKQDISKVSRAIALCTGVTFAGVSGLSAIFNLLGILSEIEHVSASNSTLQLNYPLIHFVLALGAGYLIYRYQDIRSGGYMIAPIVALTLLDPFTAIHFLIGCVIVYHGALLFCEWTLTVGLRRYVVVLSLSTLYIWGSELGLSILDPSLAIVQGSSYLLNIAMLSCVNDAILYRHKPVLRYMALMAGISIGGIVAVDMLSYLLA